MWRIFSYFRGLVPAIIVSVLAIVFLAQAGGAPNLGIRGQRAQKWGVEKWLNLPEGKSSLDIEDYKGKVLYLYCFQSWCPGCHRYGFPTLKQVIKDFEGQPDVEFVAIQTVFEGFGTNTFKRAGEVAKQYGLDIPIGHSGQRGAPSAFMRRYRTGGTPWTILIDRNGVVRYNDFHIDAGQAKKQLQSLLEENPDDLS